MGSMTACRQQKKTRTALSPHSHRWSSSLNQRSTCHSDVKMARGRSSGCLLLALWVWCASVCIASATDDALVHPEGPSKSAVATSTRLGGDGDTQPSPSLVVTTSMRKPKPGPAPDSDVDELVKVKPPPDSMKGRSSDTHSDSGDGGGSDGGSGAQNSSIGGTPVKEVASKRNTSSQGGAGGGGGGFVSAVRSSPSSSSTAEQLRSATSLAGNLVLLLISVVIAGALFVMLICFIHKWKENMGTGKYPRVVYSMLRQSEDEPEDVLGEILINIGLAAPGDSRPLTPSTSSEASRSPDPEVDISDLEGSKFTTIPLRSDEAAKRLMAPEPEESDEELLQ